MSDPLTVLRADIERVDAAIIALLAERVRLAREVGDAKRAAGLRTLDHAREAAVVRRAVELGRDAGLDEEEVRSVFWRVIGMSRRAQMGDAA
jgi:chorismate mutase